MQAASPSIPRTRSMPLSTVATSLRRTGRNSTRQSKAQRCPPRNCSTSSKAPYTAGPTATTTPRRASWCWRPNTVATGASTSVFVRSGARRLQLSPHTGRRPRWFSTRARNSRSAIVQERSLPSMGRGIGHRSSRADTTSCSSRSREARPRPDAKSLPTALRAQSGLPTERCIVRRASRLARMARFISPMT